MQVRLVRGGVSGLGNQVLRGKKKKKLRQNGDHDKSI